MRIANMDWAAVERYLAHDDRCVLPLGSTEQHARLSLHTDAILAERLAAEAAEPLGVPVFPVQSYGLAPYFLAYPGTISLRIETLLAVIRDFVASVHGQGFRRIVIVNGHGGNAPVAALHQELMAQFPGLAFKFHSWWLAPKVTAHLRQLGPDASHANWLESFPWTRLTGAEAPPGPKPPVDLNIMRASSPQGVRDLIGDGSFGGDYRKPDEAMFEVWAAAVDETRALLEGPWPPR